MRSAYPTPSSYAYRPSIRERAANIVIALLIGALIVWMLIRMGVVPPIIEHQDLKTIMLQPASGSRADTTHEKTAATKARSAPRATPKPVTHAVAPPTPPPTPKPPIAWNVIPLSHDEMAQADISNKPTRAQAQGGTAVAAASGAGAGQGGGDSKGVGQGPDGTTLYNAEWYRHPTHAELAFYEPHNNPGDGWGEIACRTAPRYAVTDCQILGETPGSGYGRAVEQAAWQFRVMPPRRNGQPIIGAWVRIHIDYESSRSGDGGSSSYSGN